MEPVMNFADVLEAIDRLPDDDQEALVEIVRHRVIERARQRLAAEAREARLEFEQGSCRAVSVEDLMKEILP